MYETTPIPNIHICLFFVYSSAIWGAYKVEKQLDNSAYARYNHAVKTASCRSAKVAVICGKRFLTT